MRDFSEGLCRVKKDGKSGFIDKTGKEVIPLTYDHVWSFSEGLCCIYQVYPANLVVDILLRRLIYGKYYPERNSNRVF